jgi:hypothetical protein
MALTEKQDTSEVVLYEFGVHDLVRFRIGADPNDQKCSDTFVVTGIRTADDGTVRWYDCFGGDATDREGIRMHRSFRPDRIRPETRKHIISHRHRPGKGLYADEG